MPQCLPYNVLYSQNLEIDKSVWPLMSDNYIVVAQCSPVPMGRGMAPFRWTCFVLLLLLWGIPVSELILDARFGHCRDWPEIPEFWTFLSFSYLSAALFLTLGIELATCLDLLLLFFGPLIYVIDIYYSSEKFNALCTRLIPFFS